MNARPDMPGEPGPSTNAPGGFDIGEERPVRVSLMGREIRLPRSRLVRTALGGGLVVFGAFGFLPILGFWMIPLGLLVLSYDFASIRRLRRRVVVWWEKRRRR